MKKEIPAISSVITPDIGGSNVFCLESYLAQEGDVFHLLRWDGFGTTSITGTTTFDPGILDVGLNWGTTYFASHGVVVVVPEPQRAVLLVAGLPAAALRRRKPSPRRICDW